jgi:GR25 family glycosyltransferase involved in LPS biosynthesis
MNCYIINLSQIPSSAQSASVLGQQLTGYGISWQLFEGSYGNVTKQHYSQTGRVCHAWGFKGPDRPLTDAEKYNMSLPGVMGCFDSHYRLWQHCVEIDQPIMVFEDDTRLIRPWISIEFDQVLIVATSHDKKLAKYSNYLYSPSGQPRACEYHQASMPGTAGYVIKPAAAKILVDAYQNSFLPSDNAINQTLVQIEIHSHLMGRAQDRDPTGGKSSLVKTDFWNTNSTGV